MNRYEVRLRVVSTETVFVWADNEIQAEVNAINGYESGDLVDMNAQTDCISAMSVEEKNEQQ
jgi:hypothetical protein